MKERPILFSAPMVRAILEGRKTQTRRVVNPRHIPNPQPDLDTAIERSPSLAAAFCPYGQPGERLWVRETFDPIYGQSPPGRVIEIDYKADWVPHGNRWRIKDELGSRRWTPSIHMPRWVSRILLEITGVRVERLQDISEADVIAEGFKTREGNEAFNFAGTKEFFIPELLDHNPIGRVACGGNVSAKEAYRRLWSSINGRGSWDANPWVWVVEFKRLEGGAE